MTRSCGSSRPTASERCRRASSPARTASPPHEAADELLVDIHLPAVNGWRATYVKLRRRASFDFPVLGVAARVKTAADGTVEEATIVLGAVHPSPMIVKRSGRCARRSQAHGRERSPRPARSRSTRRVRSTTPTSCRTGESRSCRLRRPRSGAAVRYRP
ncbi:MAG: hypothetical protein IPF53_09250 [Blastocatellia bacterium]|nr:hypothetical protein [Blastocatellia bacterium]